MNNNLPPIDWEPNQEVIERTHLYAWMQKFSFAHVEALQHFSDFESEPFWQEVINTLNIQFDTPSERILDTSHGLEQAMWLKNAQLNIVKSCLQHDPHLLAIIEQNESGEVRSVTYGELNAYSNQIANTIAKEYPAQTRIGILMPMTIDAVAIHLGIIKAGCCTVAIAESFSGREILLRAQIADTKLIFMQRNMQRDQKTITLYEEERIKGCPPIVLLSDDEDPNKLHRSIDRPFKDWIHGASKSDYFVACPADSFTTILFSSGTTGTPKAIPWTHITPLKCASDAYFHHDLHPQERFCWPTSLGWMMGSWLIYACFLNKATMALYNGTPIKQGFGAFIESASVTHLGVVPTIVKQWRESKCMEPHDWSAIRLFTSTGECSNPDDMRYLMALGKHKPIIEYCGGTEIGGAYITGTLVQAASASMFTTKAMGNGFIILNTDGKPCDFGEVFLTAPSIGLSEQLLNADHHTIYYSDTPSMPEGDHMHLLRRHGDWIEQYANGFYQLRGRADDTMNLGGIKVSSAEIEEILLQLPMIREVAAVGIAPEQGGPEQLTIFVVLNATNNLESSALERVLQKTIRTQLNPLFKIYRTIILDALPRTSSNKIIRRLLKEQVISRPTS